MPLQAAVAIASILIILGGAALFSWIVARAGIPAAIASELVSVTSNGAVALFLIFLVLLVMEMFIETISTLILIVPVLASVAQAYGFDPIQFSILIIVAVLLGPLTPPVAVLLLLACKISGVGYGNAMGLFLAVLSAGLLATCMFPR